MVHDSVGVVPLPVIDTSTGKGTALSVPASDGPGTLSAASPGRSKRNSQGSARRPALKAVEREQMLGAMISGPHAPWPATNPLGP